MTPIDATPAPVRAISLVLPEAQWRALCAVEPDPVAWLQEVVRARLESGQPARRD